MNKILTKLSAWDQPRFIQNLETLKAYLTREQRYDLRKLECLEAGGVDNWEWYDDSLAPMRDDGDDDAADDGRAPPVKL